MARSISNSLSFSSRLVELECRMKNWQDRMNRILEYSLQKFRRGGGGGGEKLNILSNEMLYIYKYIFIRKTVWFTVMDNMKESFS